MRNFNLTLCFLLLSCIASAQNASEGTDTDFRSRLSAGVDWKLAKGLHLDAGYELRLEDGSSKVERNQFNAGISYSPMKFLDLGAGYCFIGHVDSNRDFKPKHRFYADAAVSHKAGQWKLSLKERIQLTNKPYEFNEYQQTRNFLELKTRLKIAYKGLVHIEPYASVELRNCFNAPKISATYDESTGKYRDFVFSGYSDCYINRIRGMLGVEWNINRSNSIDFRLMEDWCRSKDIDTNSEGTKLKSYMWKNLLNTTLAVSYLFSF